MIVLLMLMLLAVPAVACPTGCVEVDKQTCACDATPLVDSKLSTINYASDEKAPTNKMPSYERAGIKAEMPKSLIASDSDADRAKQDADAEGKRKAGL